MNDLIKVLALIFLGAGAWYFYNNVIPKQTPTAALISTATPPSEKTVFVEPTIINAAIADAAADAEKIALQYAKVRIEEWHIDTMRKVDAYYLDWHFDYFRNITDNVKTFITSFVKDEHEIAFERQEKIAGKFSRMITPPLLVEQYYRQIAEETAQVFAREFKDIAKQIPQKYNLQQTHWERHLAGITLLTLQTEGLSEESLTMKTMLVGGSAAAAMGSLALIDLAVPLVDVALTTLGLDLGIGSVALMEGASFGGPFIAGLVAVAVGTWEFIDHSKTVARNKPLLREQIDEYLKGFENDQLKPTGAIGSPIHQLKIGISQSLGVES